MIFVGTGPGLRVMSKSHPRAKALVARFAGDDWGD